MNPTLTKALNAIWVWIDQTPLSQAIQVTNWVVPAVQTVHILAIAVHHRPDQGRALGDPGCGVGCRSADHHRGNGRRSAEKEPRRSGDAGRRHGRHGLLIFYVQVNNAPSPKGVRNAYAQIWTRPQATFYRGNSTRNLETDGPG